MEMTSSVMRFALATYFMKRGGSSHLSSSPGVLSSLNSPSYEPTSDFSGDEEESEDVDPDFSDVVSTHVSNLMQLLAEKRFQEWSSGIVELRDYAADNELLGSLVAVLMTMIRRQEHDAESIVQVIEHMCFEKGAEPSPVFDQLIELLFEALGHCCANKDTTVAIWLLRAIDGVSHGLRQSHEQLYGDSQRSVYTLEQAATKLIRECLAGTGS
ncbi:hypothetical protein PR001_g10958 [Phytophthora rubi]|uniref:Uncharacterized protein n=1 Tax=Phytophthora rubi TaxID=129364 RepID=A0A6A3M8Z5_9STRA|nr:hypothetical protein PR002_g10993 [Phytophthora rubi]KAE9031671.1 hypothetical protein PR001_g10958 [Phytophthora rubi]